MSQQNSNQKDTHLNEMLEIKNYAEFKHKVLSNIPNLKLMAKSFMQQHIKKLTGQDIDPDKVRLYTFKSASASPKTYSGWEYWDPEKSLTLTDLAFKNFSAHDQDLTSDDLKLNYGVYEDGPKEKYTGLFNFGKEYFGEKNQIRILPSDLRKILKENDFYALVKNSLNTFWEKHEADMLTLAKATFVSEARLAMLEGVLSEADYKLVMQIVVPHIPLDGPVTIDQLASKTHSQGYVYFLDINGYSSNDILRFVKNDGHEILYIPGEEKPFEVFKNDNEMRQWIVEQGKISEKLSRLESHFSLYNRQDGYFHKGVDNGLLNLISGSWDISGSGIDKNGNAFFARDVLSTVIKETKERSFSDADIVIKSNAEISWEQWLGYTKIANQMFGPIIGLCGTFGAILATGAFVTQIGMEVHQAVIGDTEEERKQGFWAAGIDIGTTLLFAGFAKFAEVKNELSELSELVDETPVREGVEQKRQFKPSEKAFRSDTGKEVSVVCIGKEKGRDIWVQVNPETGKCFGRKYYRNNDGSLQLMPVNLRERINIVTTKGLTGGRKLPEEEQAASNVPKHQHLDNPDIAGPSEPKRQRLNNPDINYEHLAQQIEILRLLDDSSLGKRNEAFRLFYSEFNKTKSLETVDMGKFSLSKANFNDVDISGFNLEGIDMHDASFICTKLIKTNLSKANLEGADFADAEMSYANLSEAKLNNASFVETTLKGANISNAKLHEAIFVSADLTEAKIIGADMTGVDLGAADLTNAQLDKTTLNKADLSEANFTSASLANCNMLDVNICATNLLDANLDGTIIMLGLPNNWNEENLDVYLNHINNYESGSVLTAIDSIQTSYSPLKIKLFHQLIDSIKNVDITSIEKPLIDILSENEYMRDDRISNFVQSVFYGYLKKINMTALNLNQYDENVLNALLKLFERDTRNLMDAKECNGAFNQIILQAMKNNEHIEAAKNLYQRYIDSDLVKRLLRLENINDNFGDFLCKPDWTDNSALNYIILSNDTPERIMLVSSDALSKMLTPLSDNAWSNFMLFDHEGTSLSKSDYSPISQLFTKSFPLFSESYIFSTKKTMLINLLKSLNLGEELESQFILAIKNSSMNEKMVDGDIQVKLDKIFNKEVYTLKIINDQQQPLLTEKHYENILSIYNLTNSNPQERAKTFFSLSTVFCHYSSSKIFGKELDSPIAIRNYSAALLQKAYALDPLVFGNNADSYFTELNNKLLGLNNEFTCTSVLADNMTHHGKTNFPDVMNIIVPSIWG